MYYTQKGRKQLSTLIATAKKLDTYVTLGNLLLLKNNNNFKEINLLQKLKIQVWTCPHNLAALVDFCKIPKQFPNRRAMRHCAIMAQYVEIVLIHLTY